MRQEKPSVMIVMGSQSDWPVMKHAADTLREFGISFHARIMSAHRNPSEAAALAEGARAAGVRVLIAAAGMAAHLAGVLAARTTLPVIGVPLAGSALNGLDALLSTVQMPQGVPVATMAIGKAGAANAALLAAQILALGDSSLQARLDAFKEKQCQAVREADEALQRECDEHG